MYLVHVSQAAEQDLIGLLDYIRRDSPAMADHVETHLANAIDSLETYPDRGALTPESETWGYPVRMLVVFNYRILYTVRTNDVVVLRIVHGSQMTPVRPRQ
jgi:toxin ParE1/3/4